MNSDRYTFLVVENAVDVCEGIERRMKPFENWASLGFCVGVKEAIAKIKSHKPHLIYLDWSLNGGSAFEVLQHVQNMNNYNPYIIFNTGYQSENPEIPQEIINIYKVDKYLVKPFWETLRKNLSTYLSEAERKHLDSTPKSKSVWVPDGASEKKQITLESITCIAQHPDLPRKRLVYQTDNTNAIEISLSWEDCYALLKEYEIDFFVTKTRSHLVVRKFVLEKDGHFVRVKGLPFKVDVVKEKIREFENWLTKST